MRILLATDFSVQAETARDLVAGLPLPARSHIRVVHAIEPMTSVTAFAPIPMLDLGEEAVSELRSELDRFVQPLHAADRSVDLRIPFGRAADVLLEEADRFGAELIVIGSRGRGGIASMLLGSVSAEIVDRAACPVLVARGTTLTRVLLAEDGSAPSAIGANLVADLPFLRTLPVRVVSVVDVPFPYPLGEDAQASSAAVDAYYKVLPPLREKHETLARERAQTLRTIGVTASSEMREGDAAAQIIEAAEKEKADCVVIGSRGRTGLTRLMIGSVARAVLFHASCSVLIAHPTTRPAIAPTTSATEGALA